MVLFLFSFLFFPLPVLKGVILPESGYDVDGAREDFPPFFLLFFFFSSHSCHQGGNPPRLYDGEKVQEKLFSFSPHLPPIYIYVYIQVFSLIFDGEGAREVFRALYLKFQFSQTRHRGRASPPHIRRGWRERIFSFLFFFLFVFSQTRHRGWAPLPHIRRE